MFKKHTYVGAFALIELEQKIRVIGKITCANGHIRPLEYEQLEHCPLCHTKFKSKKLLEYATWYDVIGDNDDTLSTMSGEGIKESQLFIVSNRNDGTSLKGDLIILSPEQISRCLEIFTQKFSSTIKDLPYVKSSEIHFGTIAYYS